MERPGDGEAEDPRREAVEGVVSGRQLPSRRRLLVLLKGTRGNKATMLAEVAVLGEGEGVVVLLKFRLESGNTCIQP